MRANPGLRITRYDVCKLVSKAYLKAFTPSNLVSAFRKTGIYPLNRGEINTTNFMPGDMLHSTATAPQERGNDLAEFFDAQVPHPADPKANHQKRKFSYRPGGVAITEDKIILKIKRVMAESKKKKRGNHKSNHRTTPTPLCRPFYIILSSRGVSG